MDCGCTYSTMHLLNCLLLMLYKHSRRSHCLPKPNPSAFSQFYLFCYGRERERDRERERAHQKFRGHCIDGMMLEVPLALLSDVVGPHLKPVVVGGLLEEDPQHQYTDEGQCVFTQGLWAGSNILKVQRGGAAQLQKTQGGPDCFSFYILTTLMTFLCY